MMADQAVTNEVDSSKPARKCAWCGVDISARHPNARHCSPAHREAYAASRRWNRQRTFNGPFAGRACVVCGEVFECRDDRQIYCARGGSCSQRAYRESPKGAAYFRRQDVKHRRREAARRHAETEHGKASQKERDARPKNVARRRAWALSEHGREVKVENQRRRAADRAMALLLMPVHKLEEN